MFREERQTNMWYQRCVPVHWGVTNYNTLGSTLGEQIARGLSGGGDDDTSDNIWYLNNGSWERYWLTAGKVWKDTNDVDATLQIKPGQGFWLKRYTAGPAVTNTVYTGRTHTNSTPIAVRSNEWNVVAWPFAVSKTHDGSDTNMLGFVAAGAHGAPNNDIGAADRPDEILVWQDGGWKSKYWLIDGL